MLTNVPETLSNFKCLVQISAQLFVQRLYKTCTGRRSSPTRTPPSEMPE